ncbi:MAG: hypothetical protein QOF56_4154 [Acidobacteriaceae bacterium]|nr:hypothetical protein [Acidobacteriaceae bacterium]
MRSGELTLRRGTKLRCTPAIIDNRRRVNTNWVWGFGKANKSAGSIAESRTSSFQRMPGECHLS